MWVAATKNATVWSPEFRAKTWENHPWNQTRWNMQSSCPRSRGIIKDVQCLHRRVVKPLDVFPPLFQPNAMRLQGRNPGSGARSSSRFNGRWGASNTGTRKKNNHFLGDLVFLLTQTQFNVRVEILMVLLPSPQTCSDASETLKRSDAVKRSNAVTQWKRSKRSDAVKRSNAVWNGAVKHTTIFYLGTSSQEPIFHCHCVAPCWNPSVCPTIFQCHFVQTNNVSPENRYSHHSLRSRISCQRRAWQGRTQLRPLLLWWTFSKKPIECTLASQRSMILCSWKICLWDVMSSLCLMGDVGKIPTCRCRATSGVEKRSLLILNGHLNASHVPAAGAVGWVLKVLDLAHRIFTVKSEVKWKVFAQSETLQTNFCISNVVWTNFQVVTWSVHIYCSLAEWEFKFPIVSTGQMTISVDVFAWPCFLWSPCPWTRSTAWVSWGLSIVEP